MTLFVGILRKQGHGLYAGEAYLMNISSDIGGIDLELIEKKSISGKVFFLKEQLQKEELK